MPSRICRTAQKKIAARHSCLLLRPHGVGQSGPLRPPPAYRLGLFLIAVSLGCSAFLICVPAAASTFAFDLSFFGLRISLFDRCPLVMLHAPGWARNCGLCEPAYRGRPLVPGALGFFALKRLPTHRDEKGDLIFGHLPCSFQTLPFPQAVAPRSDSVCDGSLSVRTRCERRRYPPGTCRPESRKPCFPRGRRLTTAERECAWQRECAAACLDAPAQEIHELEEWKTWRLPRSGRGPDSCPQSAAPVSNAAEEFNIAPRKCARHAS